jgi:hypothetical protein
MIVGIAYAAATFVFVFWCLHCNNKTCRQRKALINIDTDSDENGPGRSWTTIQHEVSYNAHMYCLMQMKNPYKLYKIKKK